MAAAVADTSAEKRARSTRNFRRADTRESTKLPVAANGPSAAKISANDEPVTNQIASDATIGTVAATTGNRNGAAGCGAVGSEMRGSFERESVTFLLHQRAASEIVTRCEQWIAN